MTDLPTRRVTRDLLDVEITKPAPPADSLAVLHGFPYDIHSYAEVAPLLAESGYRVIVPYLRGHGSTPSARTLPAPAAGRALSGARAPTYSRCWTRSAFFGDPRRLRLGWTSCLCRGGSDPERVIGTDWSRSTAI